MELSFGILVVGIISIAVGSVLGYFARQSIAKKQLGTAEGKANKMLKDAESQAQDTMLAAKNKAVEILEQVKKEESKRQEQIFRLEKRIESREENLDKKMEEVDRGRDLLIKKAEEIKRIRKEAESAKQEQLKRLEKVAGLSRDDAKKVLLQLAEEQNKEILAKQIKKMEQFGKEELEKKAKNIMTIALQRYAGSHAMETTTSTVALPSDEIKGRIIGREGRNIKTLERLTGIEVIVDDTPEAIVISGFNPVRREIARIAIEKLIEDGRIHPTRIEEAINFAKAEVNNKIKEAGEAAAYDVGIAGLDPKLIQLLGRLRFRTSYGQNVLLHSLEVAHLSGALAGELGADVGIAKKAGLLHDIGKAIDHEVQGTHIEIGINILKKFGIDKAVIDAMKSHHEDFPFESNESMIIAAADALSASRPGARKDTLEDYLKRLTDLENVAQSFSGVEKTYAIQAGREIRVFVRPEEIDDLAAVKLARGIADKIEQELKYPGEIKVNVLRETRAVEVAR
jgi:ribonucrease Y